MPDKNIEEQRQLALQTLNFFQVERNKAIFQLSTARMKRMEAEKVERIALEKCRFLKKRLINELEKSLPILEQTDLNDNDSANS